MGARLRSRAAGASAVFFCRCCNWMRTFGRALDCRAKDSRHTLTDTIRYRKNLCRALAEDAKKAVLAGRLVKYRASVTEAPSGTVEVVEAPVRAACSVQSAVPREHAAARAPASKIEHEIRCFKDGKHVRAEFKPGARLARLEAKLEETLEGKCSHARRMSRRDLRWPVGASKHAVISTYTWVKRHILAHAIATNKLNELSKDIRRLSTALWQNSLWMEDKGKEGKDLDLGPLLYAIKVSAERSQAAVVVEVAAGTGIREYLISNHLCNVSCASGLGFRWKEIYPVVDKQLGLKWKQVAKPAANYVEDRGALAGIIGMALQSGWPPRKYSKESDFENAEINYEGWRFGLEWTWTENSYDIEITLHTPYNPSDIDLQEGTVVKSDNKYFQAMASYVLRDGARGDAARRGDVEYVTEVNTIL